MRMYCIAGREWNGMAWHDLDGVRALDRAGKLRSHGMSMAMFRVGLRLYQGRDVCATGCGAVSSPVKPMRDSAVFIPSSTILFLFSTVSTALFTVDAQYA